MKVKCLHSGQYHPYGDSFYKYEITLEDGENPSEQEILEAVHNGSRLPYDVWKQRAGNISEYFKGYYLPLERKGNKIFYHGCYPYDD